MTDFSLSNWQYNISVDVGFPVIFCYEFYLADLLRIWHRCYAVKPVSLVDLCFLLICTSKLGNYKKEAWVI